MNKQKLRIGLLLDGYDAPYWFYKIIETLMNSEHSEVVLVVKKKEGVTKKLSFWRKFWKLRKDFFSWPT